MLETPPSETALYRLYKINLISIYFIVIYGKRVSDEHFIMYHTSEPIIRRKYVLGVECFRAKR